MQYKIEHLKEEFENEMWLYIDGTLSDERIKFWNNRFSEFPELQNILIEAESLLNSYNCGNEEEMPDEILENMLLKIHKKEEGRFLKLFAKEEKAKTFKMVLGLSLAAASTIILLLSNKPNPVKNMGKDLLDWDAEKINTRIENVESSLMFLKDDRAKNYFQNKLANDKWTRDVYNINSSIQKIKRELKESSL